ncbi:DUF418 domain-containing protein [Kribbella sandramycini]|uniref:DUF418 domain-containing protein n=1 Tax=Kribbella sandramycini TaxID=60450 RepID=A0A7Y4L0T5_9ACTN|nr:DUF418 domain-containing protein [Kribbella sandramycini]MBB6564521.1 putative membrane protein YeiB [Kribbella sandramycini]NOL42225.1 DUF418 domain-containing protein [Kribbella sandramycini]
MTERAGNPPTTGPTATSARALGPDLARGILLLFIAVANSHGLLQPAGVRTIRAMPIASALPDRVVAFLETTLVDGRSYTMFAALFGYGVVQIARRQSGDWKSTRKLLRRRAWWLLLLGVLHGTLLYYGDILAAYGLIALLFVPFLRFGDKWVLYGAGVMVFVGSGVYGILSMPIDPSTDGRGPWYSIAISAPILLLTAAGPFLFGVWAARRRLFEDVEQHRPTLRRMAAIGIPVSFLGGIPLALYTSGLLHATDANVLPAGALHALTGYVGGPAYAALIALWSLRVRRTALVTALQATGQRSLTFYLAQSVVWAIVFTLFGLGTKMALWQAALLAVATWALTVVLAGWMRRRGFRGPFEVLIRRLTYRE